MARLAVLTLVLAALLAPLYGQQARAQTPDVSHDWRYIPHDVDPGETFRLLFITSEKTPASSSDIGYYNTFVQKLVRRNPHLSCFGESFVKGFRALISTSAVDARNNTSATGTGVSIHWLGLFEILRTFRVNRGGPWSKVAENYADFWDGDWGFAFRGTTETGRQEHNFFVWTGSNFNGTKRVGSEAGAEEVTFWQTSSVEGKTSPQAPFMKEGGSTSPSSTKRSLLALSPLLKRQSVGGTATVCDVTRPAITRIEVTSSPPGGRNYYETGERIDFTITFSENIVVTGTPKLVVRVGQSEKKTSCSKQGGDKLVCPYTVVEGDMDGDGIEIRRLELPGGAAIKDSSNNKNSARLAYDYGSASSPRVNPPPKTVDTVVPPSRQPQPPSSPQPQPPSSPQPPPADTDEVPECGDFPDFDCSKAIGLGHRECEALVALYDSTDGENWDWMDIAPRKERWFTTCSPANWEGIELEEDSVRELALSEMNLTGELPEELEYLENLESLDLSNNKELSGELPGNSGELSYVDISCSGINEPDWAEDEDISFLSGCPAETSPEPGTEPDGRELDSGGGGCALASGEEGGSGLLGLLVAALVLPAVRLGRRF